MQISIIFAIIFILVVGPSEGQVNRSTSACSVPLCASSAARNANGSCSTGPSQLCYSYQVPLTNQTFCAPSVSCSLFEPCADNVACSSNTSICLSTTCCQRSICMPIVLGVTACNSTIPVILPTECYSHTVNSDYTRNVAYNSSSSLCDQAEFSVAKWVRFSGPAGTQLSSTVYSTARCGGYYTSYLNEIHPTRLGEKKTASVCYNYYGSCNWQSSITITNCGEYFVYFLSAPPTCNMRYCTV